MEGASAGSFIKVMGSQLRTGSPLGSGRWKVKRSVVCLSRMCIDWPLRSVSKDEFLCLGPVNGR